jgi:hypothetical protein
MYAQPARWVVGALRLGDGAYTRTGEASTSHLHDAIRLGIFIVKNIGVAMDCKGEGGGLGAIGTCLDTETYILSQSHDHRNFSLCKPCCAA